MVIHRAEEPQSPNPWGWQSRASEDKHCIGPHKRVKADCLDIINNHFRSLRILLDVAKLLYLIAIRNRKGIRIPAKPFMNYLEYR